MLSSTNAKLFDRSRPPAGMSPGLTEVNCSYLYIFCIKASNETFVPGGSKATFKFYRSCFISAAVQSFVSSSNGTRNYDYYNIFSLVVGLAQTSAGYLLESTFQ